MKVYYLVATVVFTLTLSGLRPGGPAVHAAPLVHESEKDLVLAADFDGDGKEDVVIVDKATGKYRLGYQQTPGVFNWVKMRKHDVKGVTGISAGKILAPDKMALALASADSSKVVVVDVSNPDQVGEPVTVPVTVLGPGTVSALDIGGAGNTPVADLAIGSIYNPDPTPNKLSLMRSAAGKFSPLGDTVLAGSAVHANVITLKAGGPELLAMLINEDNGDVLQIDDVSSGKAVTVARAGGIPSGSDYVAGNFQAGTLKGFVFFKSEEESIGYRAAVEKEGKVELGPVATFKLEKAVKQMLVVNAGATSRLLIIFGNGETAGLYDFDGAKAPASVQEIKPQEGDVFFGAIPLSKGLVMYGSPEKMRYSSKYTSYVLEGGQYAKGSSGSLATLDDSDEWTISEIHKLIVQQNKIASAADMKVLTNVVPGSNAKFVMLPIPGGEFMMGSPETEKGRKPDESPQHKVKIKPFWMGRHELTWSEYELFMYKEDEQKLRETFPTPEDVNTLSDAVSRPSKPYVEMSFGMGKDGFPAIAMTHHAAAKYCHWLSAKTGQFYRLPTEAEWEYACRAGTTTPYSFGDDASKLGEYAWTGKNSDFKYQKIGKKKPNAWGLYDMHGNVLEWCIDQYDPEFYKQFAGKEPENPWLKATKPYGHVARGGHWDEEDPALFRSAARRGSERNWKMTDPQLPKSYWYLSDAQWVGIRLVRPLEIPSPEEMQKFWITGTEKD